MKLRTKWVSYIIQVVCSEDQPTAGNNERKAVQINAIEHEFKFHDGVWRFILKDVKIKSEQGDISVHGLKGIFFPFLSNCLQ
jgi:hypothetical protein